MVLMIACAFDLDLFAIQQKALIDIEAGRAHAETDRFGVAHFSIGFDGDLRGIKRRRLRRPKLGLRYLYACGKTCRPVRSHLLQRRIACGDPFLPRTEDRPPHTTGGRVLSLVLHLGTKMQDRRVALQIGADVALPSAQVDGIGLEHPHMTVNPSAFIKPAVAQARIHAHDQEVGTAPVHVIGDIEGEWAITVVVASEEEAVHKDKGIAKHTIELERDAAAFVFFGNLEFTTVPAHASGWIAAAKRLVAMPLQAVIVNKRKFDGPVMGQAELAPFCIVEFFFGEGEGSGFGEVSLTGTEVKIEGGIGSIALEKFPIEVHQQALAGSRGGSGHLRRRSEELHRMRSSVGDNGPK